MKAAQISQYGDASVVTVVQVAKPAPRDGQVLIEVHAASLNPFDTTVRTGQAGPMPSLQLPFTLGGDVAGRVVAVGASVTGLAVGDAVYGQAAAVAGNSGALAEYATTAANQVAKAPAGLSFNEAAALPLVGVSALQALTQHLSLQAGQKIFITGGAGGIGRVAIQLAKHLGAYVATTASGAGLAAAKHLGADEVIDYKSQDFTSQLRDYDAVFNTVGGNEFTKTLSVLKRGGKAVTMTGQSEEAQAQKLGVTVIAQFTKVTTESLNELRDMVEAGVVKPHIGRVYQLADIQAAFIARENHTAGGKVVIAIKT